MTATEDRELMRERTAQTLAENQILVMKAMTELLLIHRNDVTGHSARVEKVAQQLASRTDTLRDLIDSGYFTAPVELGPDKNRA
jgi:hypothetical protein